MLCSTCAIKVRTEFAMRSTDSIKVVKGVHEVPEKKLFGMKKKNEMIGYFSMTT